VKGSDDPRWNAEMLADPEKAKKIKE